MLEDLRAKQFCDKLLDNNLKLAVATAHGHRPKENFVMPISVSLSTIDRLSLATSTRNGVITAATNVQIQALTDAWDAVILGAALKATKTEDTVVDVGSSVPPASKDANRGSKWLARAQDSVKGKIYTHELGTADFSQLPSATSDFLDLTAGVGLALKTAFDAIYESPEENPGVLLSVQQVTRTD